MFGGIARRFAGGLRGQLGRVARFRLRSSGAAERLAGMSNAELESFLRTR